MKHCVAVCALRRKVIHIPIQTNGVTLQVYLGLHQHVCIHSGAPAGATRAGLQGRWRHGTDIPDSKPMCARGSLAGPAAHEAWLEVTVLASA